MRILLFILAMAVFTTPAFAKDTKMSCAEIEATIEELNEIVTAAGNAEMNTAMTNAATGAATQGAIAAGLGSSVPFLGGIANAAGAFSANKEAQAKAEAEKAEKRIIKLETIADMKDCN